MPYLSCPTCALTTYTAAKFATRDECPRCSARLGGMPPRVNLFVSPVPSARTGERAPVLRSS